MKLQWFRIKNFRSIRNTKKVYFDPNTTILAGKNESGKTNILEALEKFNSNEFNEKDYPQDIKHNQNYKDKFAPIIDVSILITNNDLDIIDLLDTNKEKFELQITRKANQKYTYEGELIDILDDNIKSIVSEKYKLVNEKIDEYSKELIEFDDYFKFLKEVKINNIEGINDLINKINNNKNNVMKKLTNENKRNLDSIIKKLVEKLNKTLEFLNDEINYTEQMNKLIPNFIYFNSFEDILPNKISKEQISTENIISRFSKLANTDLKEVFNRNSHQDRKTLIEKINTEVTINFGDVYNQDPLDIEVSKDGNELYFYIKDKEKDIPMTPKQRSKGLQWFLSFFLTLNAEETSNSIILIDEPALYLHARAQKDVLEVLGKLSKDKQIMYSTHSPYMINPDNLGQIRLVKKDERKHTEIKNKVHKGAKKHTLTPVITAIGMDLTKTLPFSCDKNILVEGISDHFFLEAMWEITNTQKGSEQKLHFIPSVGASQIENMVVLLLGWNIDFKVLLDNDKEGQIVSEKLKKLMIEDKIYFISDKNEHSIEDLFSKDDFIKYILEDIDDEEIDKRNKNSTIFKQYDKPLYAKKFKEKIHNNGTINLDQETLERFENKFKQLSF